MKILFIDSHTHNYDTKTYLHQPLGGTQSAVSNLAFMLVQAGHEVAILNGISEPKQVDGVHFLNLPCPTEVLNGFDVVVPVSGAIAQTLRGVGCTRPLVLWSHHAHDQPSIQSLQNPTEHSLYAGFALISQWQADHYQALFGLPADKIKILRNAVSPSFMDSVSSANWLRNGIPPVLGYSSTPYRGLDILLLSFASIRKQLEGATLRIFSSMGIYGADVPDHYSALYDLAQSQPGVSYIGALPQPRLAEAMSEVDIWSYPCTFPETSCIAAMEAMASGTLLISTSLGALPETTAGFAHLVDFTEPLTNGMKATMFANEVVRTAQAAQADAVGTLGRLEEQIEFTRTHYTWKNRAAEWAAWLEQIL